GINRFVLCGMGGSSLAPEVITAAEGVTLVVLDSTNPEQVRAAIEADLANTAVIVSSKSGSTVETDSQKRAFEAAFDSASIDKRERIVVVTDPESPMETAAKNDGYRVFNADPTVGGRYSALTAFGLVPSGLAGADIGKLLSDARIAAESLSVDSVENPGLQLGAVLARSVNSETFRDKVGVVSAGSLIGFGNWVEQLVAESTGQQGKGVLPVVLETQSHELGAGNPDLLVVRVVDKVLTSEGDETQVSGSLGEQFLLWEFATVVASRLIGINPFDQPDVESAKIAARGMLESRSAQSAPNFEDDGIEVRSNHLDLSGVYDIPTALAKLLAELEDDGYLSIHCYLDRTTAVEAENLRNQFAKRSNRPTTFGWAPRFLHSTGQYHKGGPRQGVYLQLLSNKARDLPIPGRSFSFGELIASQAAGDAKVLAALGRPVLTLTLGDVAEGLSIIQASI
ncbi:MAG: glucose-6-phosphate isomerase, partial [Actinomycetes bacterium]